MAFLSSAITFLGDAVSAPKGFWVSIIKFFGRFITDYGWCVIVFTIFLRLVLLPLDFYQKKVAYDNKKKTEAMEPYMEKLRKQYGNDKMAMSAKQRELQKKFKFNTFGPCLPALLSMVIFITLFGGFRKIADFEIYTAYNDTRNAYLSSYLVDSESKFDAVNALYEKTLTDNEITSPKFTLDINSFTAYLGEELISESQEDGSVAVSYKRALVNNNVNLAETVKVENDPATELPDINKIYDALLKNLAQDDAVLEYETHKDGMRFLWIKNIWRPDAVWGMNGCGFATIEPVIPDAKLYKQSLTSGCMGEYRSMELYKGQKSIDMEYGIVMQKVIAANNKTVNASGKTSTVYNGYYILAVLIIGLSILSTKFNAAGNPAAAPQQAAGGDGKPGAPNMKMMMYMMPLMMGIFAISSNSAFSLYMVASTATSLLSTLLCGWGIKMYDKKKTAKAEENKFKRYVKKK